MQPFLRSARARVLALLAFAPLSCSPAPQPTSILLITLDTTRRDALTCFGGQPGVTPNLDRLAQRALLFDAAYSPVALTLPSHASMQTGLFPLRHTVRGNSATPLPQSAVTLAERARDAGYATGGFVSAVVLDSIWGIGQGFGTFDQPEGERAFDAVQMNERPAHATVEKALAWFEKRDREKPFFMWVHFFDPHGPHHAPPQFLAQAKGNTYLGEVAAMDHAIGDLLAALEAQGVRDSTTVCVISDHGESFGHKGEATHGSFCYQSTLHIPLMFAFADGWRAGERDDGIVSCVDVFPTLLESMGLDVPAGLDGISLLRRDVPPDRGVMLESYYGFQNFGWAPIVGYVDRDGKYLFSGRHEFYRVASDPGEARDVASTETTLVEHHRAALREIARRPPLAVSSSDQVEESVRERIRGLGYTGTPVSGSAPPMPLDELELPCPYDRTDELERFQAATLTGNAGKLDEAVTAFQEIVANNPGHVAALHLMGGIFTQRKQCAEAEGALQRLDALGASVARLHAAVGVCFEEEKNLPKAIAHLKLALEMQPDSAPYRAKLAQLYVAAGEPQKAQALRASGAPANASGAK